MAVILNSKMSVTPIILILHSMDCLTLKTYGYNFNSINGLLDPEIYDYNSKSRFYHKMSVTPIILILHSMDCLTLKYMIITSNQGSITHINLDININRIYGHGRWRPS